MTVQPISSNPLPQGGGSIDPRLWDLVVAARTGADLPRMTFLTPGGFVHGQLGPPEHFMLRTYESLEPRTWQAVLNGQSGRRQQATGPTRADIDTHLWNSLTPLVGAADEVAGPVATLYNVDLFPGNGSMLSLAVMRLNLTQVVAFWACANNLSTPPPAAPGGGGGGGFFYGVAVSVPIDGE